MLKALVRTQHMFKCSYIFALFLPYNFEYGLLNHILWVCAATMGNDFTIPWWFLTFMSGQSQYNQSTSCVQVFITNDTILDDTKSFTLELSPANKTKYLPFRTDVKITIYEDPNNGMLIINSLALALHEFL